MVGTGVFDGVGDGPGSDAVVYDYGRSSGRTVLACALGAFVAFYALVVALTDDFPGVPGIAPVSRWSAAFTQWGAVAVIPLPVAVYGLLRLSGVVGRHHGLAVDGRGLWYRSTTTFFRVPWPQVARVVARTSVTDTLRLHLVDAKAVRHCPGLTGATGVPTPRVERGAASVRIPLSRNLSALRRDVERFAPDVVWQDQTGVRPRSAKEPAPTPAAALRRVVVGLVVPGLVVAALLLGSLTVRTVSGYQPGDAQRQTVAGTVTSCANHGPVSTYGIGGWSRCRVEIVTGDRSTTVVVEPPYLSSGDVGGQVSLDRFTRSSEYADYYDYAPHGATHRNWLYYAAGVPLLVLAGLIGLIALWSLLGDVAGLVAVVRQRKTDRQRR